MATRMLRRGLPRVPGGEPWPPAGAAPDGGGDVMEDAGAAATAAPIVGVDAGSGSATGSGAVAEAPASSEAADAGAPSVPADSTIPAVTTPVATTATTAASAPAVARVRRGLPRVPGGEPWPPADLVPAGAPAPVSTGAPAPVSTGAPASLSAATPAAASAAPIPESIAPAATEPAESPTGTAAAPVGGGMRRGLPRVAGGEPWPPAGIVPVVAEEHIVDAVPAGQPTSAPAAAIADQADQAQHGEVVRVADVSAPLPWTRTVWDGRAPRRIAAAPASDRRRPTWPQAIAALFAAAGLGVLAAAAVAFVRTLLSLPFMQDFLAAFPGEYAPAIHVEPGFAPWIGWQHFFNMFLMVLIIRSGLTIRGEKRPTAFWTPKNNPKGKVSLTIWFHQALDILWLVNGVIFVVLLFATGHWARIVPTSWEVFPNALSAALQYVSFDWPHENGWNNYNSLQQLAYFTTVFLAAPLAAVTGFRMSGLWPKKAERLSKAYPIEWARAVHFPVMLYFVLFIVAHVALVFLTGMLANLNHMFASSAAVTWTGFWVFVLAVAAIAAGWAAARPLVIAPIAKLFGTVSGR